MQPYVAKSVWTVVFVLHQMCAHAVWAILVNHVNAISMNVQLVCTRAIHRRTVWICQDGIIVNVSPATRHTISNVMISMNVTMERIAVIQLLHVSIMRDISIANVRTILTMVMAPTNTPVDWVSGYLIQLLVVSITSTTIVTDIFLPSQWNQIWKKNHFLTPIVTSTPSLPLPHPHSGCMFEGMEISDGETISPHNQPCKICTCNKGVITCEEPICDCSTWKKSSGRDLCCPQCDPTESCLHQELKHLVFRSGEQWIYQCQTCECLVSVYI